MLNPMNQSLLLTPPRAVLHLGDIADSGDKLDEVHVQMTRTEYDRLKAAQPGSPTPLAPPPLQVPGGGPATLGGQVQAQNLPPSQTGMPQNPDAAFNPNAATNSYRPPEGVQPKPQPVVRRTGPRPIPNFSTPQPLVTLAATNLTYGEARYWQVTIVITSNTPRTLDTQVSCTFLNAGRSVGELRRAGVATLALLEPSGAFVADLPDERRLAPGEHLVVSGSTGALDAQSA